MAGRKEMRGDGKNETRGRKERDENS